MSRYSIALGKKFKKSKKGSKLDYLKQQAQSVMSGWPKWKRQIAGSIEEKYESRRIIPDNLNE